MSAMSKNERVRAVLAGQTPDRPPVSFWYHFDADHVAGQAAVDAHLKHLETFDLDFLKVMNDNGYPRPVGDTVSTAADLANLVELTGEEEEFVKQLDLIRRLKDALGGEVLMATTVFSAWPTLRNLTQPPVSKHNPPRMDPGDDPRDATISQMLRDDRSAVAEALQRIARSLATFSRKCIQAGADGVFVSVRDDWVNNRANGPETYDELVRPADAIINDAIAAGTFNMLHICGRAMDFDAFAHYPFQVLNWADRTAGPSIAYARDRVTPAICAGLDNLGTLVEGSPEAAAAEARDAVRQAKDRPMIVAPGCTYGPDRVPEANLKAAVNAVKAMA